MNLDGFEQLRLGGDEDCGVDLACTHDDCYDDQHGYRLLAYLLPYPGCPRTAVEDSGITVVETTPDLLAAGRKHLDEHHGGGS